MERLRFMEATSLAKPLLARKNIPDVRAGDTVRVYERVKEGEKTRMAIFEGLVISRKHGSEPGATITVRKISYGVGVERVFPLFAPTIERIEIVRRAKVRRAKLHYLRRRVGRQAMIRGELVPPAVGDAEPSVEASGEAVAAPSADADPASGA